MTDIEREFWESRLQLREDWIEKWKGRAFTMMLLLTLSMILNFVLLNWITWMPK